MTDLRSQPVNRIDEQDRYLESLAEDIAACRDELARLEATYARVAAWRPDRDEYDADERPTVDPRMFDLGSDVAETWRPVESVPRMVDVETGDLL